jgi:hypothetical protein
MKFPHEPREMKEIDGHFLVVYKWGRLTKNTCPRVWENVELFDAQGNKLWTVNGMERCRFWDNKIDTFVGTRTKSGRLQLTSFSGNSYDINLHTGEVTHSEYHK